MSRNKNGNNLDRIYEYVGEMSRYQLVMFVLAASMGLSQVVLGLNFSFYAASPLHRCKIVDYENDTYEIQNEAHARLVEKYIPIQTGLFKGIYDSCHLKSNNESQIEIGTNSIEKAAQSWVKCNSWVYSKEYFDHTLVTDWNLVCDEKFKRTLYSSLYFKGSLATFLTGLLSDKYGRKKIILIFMIINLLLSTTTCCIFYLGDEYQKQKELLFAIVRTFLGFFSSIYSLCVVLAIEIWGPSRRAFASNMAYYFFILGEFILVPLAYFVRDYRLLNVFCSAILAVMLSYFWIVPESPRWLTAKNQYNDAFAMFEKIAKSNKKPLDELKAFKLQFVRENDDHENQNVAQTKDQNYTLLRTFKVLINDSRIVLISLVIALNWLTNALIYYGITYNTSDLSGNPYVNYSVSAFVELLAVLISNYLYERFGRKVPYVINISCSALAFLSVLFVPSEKPFLITILAMIGKFTISFTYAGIYLIVVEMYPTVIRNSSLSVFNLVARIGPIIASYIQYLGEIYWYPFPFVVFGCFGALSTVSFVLVIPETKNKQMIDTMQEYVQQNTQ